MRHRNLLLGLAGFLFALPLLQAAPTGIYWTDNGTKTIQFSQLDGTGVTTLVTGLSYPGGIVVTGDSLFWADRDDHAIWRANADGSNVQVLVNAAPGSPRDVSVTDNFIYWAATGTLDSISRANIDGSNPTALVTTGLSFPNGIAVTGSYVYWSDSGTLSIQRSDLDGGNVVSVVSGLSSTQLPGAVVVTEQYLYWATRDIALTQGGTPQPGTIQRANIDGSGMTTLVDGLVFPQHVVATATNLYWADQNTGKIQRSNLDGTAVTDIVVGLTTPGGLDVIEGPAAIDTTPPVIQSNVSGTLGSSGWYVSDVGIDWTVTDPESTISSSTGCGTTTITADTAGSTFTCSATSLGGTSSTVVVIKRDATAPTAAASATPTANEYGWRRQNVTITFAGNDAMSGGVTCDASVILSTDGAGQSASGRCYDAAGNQSVLATASGINIDMTAPTVTITSPINATFRRKAALYAQFSCTDASSGVLSCVGTVPNDQKIDTSKKVTNAVFNVTAVDRAGNTATSTVRYNVK